MKLLSINHIPGAEYEALGIVKGAVVQTKNFGKDFMAGMKTLLNRAAEPQEIIDLCLFIASDKGQFINGENIMIDGGRNAATRFGS